MGDRRIALGFFNCDEELEEVQSLIASDIEQPTVQLISALRQSGKSELLKEIYRANRDLLRVFVDLEANDISVQSILRTLRSGLGLSSLPAPVPSSATIKSGAFSKLTIQGSSVELGPVIDIERLIEDGLDLVVERLAASDVRVLLLLDGIDRARADVRSFVLERLLPRVGQCSGTVVFITTAAELVFAGAAGVNCYAIHLPEIEEAVFVDACARVGITLTPEQLHIAYIASNKSPGAIFSAIEHLANEI